MTIYSKLSPPNVCIGGPVLVPSGFPIEAFGNDGLQRPGTALRTKLRAITELSLKI
jgi:hypothetical protein